MIVQVPTEVVPLWFIEKWRKENAVDGSALSFWIEAMIKDWKMEEFRMNNQT